MFCRIKVYLGTWNILNQSRTRRQRINDLNASGLVDKNMWENNHVL